MFLNESLFWLLIIFGITLDKYWLKQFSPAKKEENKRKTNKGTKENKYN